MPPECVMPPVAGADQEEGFEKRTILADREPARGTARRSGRVRRRQRRRRREDAQPDDRRPRAADRRPVGLRSSGPQGRRPGGGADPRGGQGGRRRPHRQDRARRRPDRIRRRRCRRRASSSTRRTRAASRAGTGRHPTTIPVARSVAIRDERPADLARFHRGRRSPTSRTTVSSTGRRRPTASRARRWPIVVEEALGGAQGKTINIGAPNDPYGTGLADTFSEPWEAKGGQVGERVIYDPEQPSYNTEALKIAWAPRRYVIFDYPPTYEKLGPALVRTGRGRRVRRSSPMPWPPATCRRAWAPKQPRACEARPGLTRHRRSVGGLRQAVHGRAPGPRGRCSTPTTSTP